MRMPTGATNVRMPTRGTIGTARLAPFAACVAIGCGVTADASACGVVENMIPAPIIASAHKAAVSATASRRNPLPQAGRDLRVGTGGFRFVKGELRLDHKIKTSESTAACARSSAQIRRECPFRTNARVTPGTLVRNGHSRGINRRIRGPESDVSRRISVVFVAVLTGLRTRRTDVRWRRRSSAGSRQQFRRRTRGGRTPARAA
jgi:hypothetical protein